MNTETLCERVLELDSLGTDGPWKAQEDQVITRLPSDEKNRNAIEFVMKEEFPTIVLSEATWIQFPPKGWDEMQKVHAQLIAEYRSAAPILAKEVLKLREALELIELGKLDCDPVLIAREALGVKNDQ